MTPRTMRALRRALSLVALLGALTRPLVAQASPTLVVHRLDGDSVVFDAGKLASLPHTEVQASEHGRAGRFGGVPLPTLLAAAGVRADSLRGPALADVLLVEASDGYRVTFSLAELVPDLGGRVVLLVDRRDGAPLDAKEGPLRLVVPADGRPTRWARQVRAMSVVRVGGPPRAKPSH